MAFGMAIVHL